jgi:hypothetical protein
MEELKSKSEKSRKKRATGKVVDGKPRLSHGWSGCQPRAVSGRLAHVKLIRGPLAKSGCTKGALQTTGTCPKTCTNQHGGGGHGGPPLTSYLGYSIGAPREHCRTRVWPG